MAKATSSALDPKRAEGSRGVWAAACVERSTRNTGDPAARSLAGQGVSYRPKVKSAAAQREPDGSKGGLLPGYLARARKAG